MKPPTAQAVGYPMGVSPPPESRNTMSNTDDTPDHDRTKAREALEAAYTAATEGDAQKADALTRIADARIRMAFSERPEA